MDEMNRQESRRDFLLRGAIGGVALALLGRKALALVTGPRPSVASSPAPTPMVVYMDPGCGCCGKWVSLMDAAGFETSVQRTTNMPSIKKRYGIGTDLVSCHTAIVGGYLVEGHVPADLIRKMLADQAKIAGLAVPGMVAGSPGMEGPTKDPYDVIAFDAAGKTSVYARR
jgi:hypothetical protein